MFKQITTYDKVAAVLASIVLASCTLIFTLGISKAPVYTDFVVGYSAWHASSKFSDLLAAPVVITTFCLAFIGLNFILEKQDTQGILESKKKLSYQLIIWSLPAIAVIFRLLYIPEGDSDLVYFSGVSILFVSLTTFLNQIQKRITHSQIFGIYFLGLIFIALIPLEILLLFNKLLSRELSFIPIPNVFGLTAIIMILGFILGIFYSIHSPQKIKQNLRPLLFIGQIGLSCFYLFLYPAKLFSLSSQTTAHYSSTIWLKLFIITLILVSIIDVILRNKRFFKTQNLLQLLSPWSIFSLFLSLKFSVTSLPIIPSDDYHFGEQLLGWFSYIKGAIPYVDYIPPHGLISDDLSALISNVFYDGTAATIGESTRLVLIILSLLSFLSLYYFSNSILLPFISLFCFDNVSISSYITTLALIPFICLWSSHKLYANPILWMIVWLISTSILILGIPPQGLILTASFSFMFFHCGWRLYKRRSQLSKPVIFSLIFGIIGWVCLLGLTPYGSMLIGAIQYVLVNGKLNQVAYGLPWSLSFKNQPINFLFEIIRMSWFGFPLITISCVYYFKNKVNNNKSIASYDIFFFLRITAFFLFVLLLIPYSMGRLAPDEISRPGLVSNFAWAILFPMITWNLANHTSRIYILFFSLCLNSLLSFTPLSFNNFFSALSPTISVSTVQNGSQFGLEKLGISIIEKEHLNRLIKTNKILNKSLEPQDTYLDLTSRNAQYFYFDRRPPIPITAPYNMVPLSQQKDAVLRLQRNLPKVALFEAANIINDGGVVALRNPYLYRFVMEHYRPEFRDGLIFGRLINDASNIKVENNLEAVELQLKPITDNYWVNGIHRSDAKIMIDNPYAFQYIGVGDRLKFADDVIGEVIKKDEDSSLLWLDKDLSHLADKSSVEGVQWLASQKKFQEYQLELLHQSFAAPDLHKIPVAWGNSAESLAKKMYTVAEVANLPAVTHDLQLTASGHYEVQGYDPFMVFDLSQTEISGQDAGILQFDFSCLEEIQDSKPQAFQGQDFGTEQSPQAPDPRIQIFWWGGSSPTISEPYSLRLTASGKTLIVPLDSFPRWLKLDQIDGLRFDLDSAELCHEISIQNISLKQRNFN